MTNPAACDPYCGRSDEPEGYLQRLGWFRHMAVKHTQFRCPRCGLYTIWVKR